MIVILDASTLINLANGEVFAKIVSMAEHEFFVGAVVDQESRTVARAVLAAVTRGDIQRIDDNTIDADAFQAAVDTWGLGAGETECLLAATALGCSIACDDGAARRVIEREVGAASLTGSVGLLRQAVQAGVLSSDEAFAAYERMKRRGGYLPDIPRTGF